MRKLITAMLAAGLLIVSVWAAPRAETARQDRYNNKTLLACYDDSGNLVVLNIRVDANGNIITVTSLSGPVTIGGQPLTVVGPMADGSPIGSYGFGVGGKDVSANFQFFHTSNTGLLGISDKVTGVDNYPNTFMGLLQSDSGNSGVLTGIANHWYDGIAWDMGRGTAEFGMWADIKQSVPLQGEPQAGRWLTSSGTIGGVSSAQVISGTVGQTIRVVGYTITVEATANDEGHGTLHWTNTATTGETGTVIDQFDSSPEGGIKEKNRETSRLRASTTNEPLYITVSALGASATVRYSIRYVKE